MIDLIKRQQIREDMESRKEIPIPPYILKDSSKDDSTFDKLSLMISENQSLSKQVRSDSERISEAEQKMIQDSAELVYKIMIATFGAILTGMAMGGCIVSCCLRSYKNRQQKRLEEAKHQNLRFVEVNGAIGMPTEVDQKNTQVQEVGAGAEVGDNEAQISEKVEEINISINTEEA